MSSETPWAGGKRNTQGDDKKEMEDDSQSDADAKCWQDRPPLDNDNKKASEYYKTDSEADPTVEINRDRHAYPTRDSTAGTSPT